MIGLHGRMKERDKLYELNGRARVNPMRRVDPDWVYSRALRSPSVVRAVPSMIASVPRAPIVTIVVVEAKAAVMAEMAAMEPMAAESEAADVTSAKAADVTSVKATTDMASAEAATDMASAEAAAAETAMTAPATTASTPTAHQYQLTATCSQIGVVGIARLRERCRGRKRKRKSADDTKRNTAFHDCTTRGCKPTRRARLTAGRAHIVRQG